MSKKIKGLKKLNKAITAELSPFGISKASCGTEYSFCYADDSITYKITEGAIDDIWFSEFVKERFNLEAESFILSILHEVGHYKTNDEIQGEIFNFCTREKNRISAEIKDADEKLSKKLEWEYFNLPDEIMATQWAVNYIQTHKKKVQNMREKIRKALIKFYNKNNVREVG